MRLFGRHCSSGELFMFAMAYLFGNYFVLKMQQQWRHQQLVEHHRKLEAARMSKIHQLSSKNQFVGSRTPEHDLHLQEGSLVHNKNRTLPTANNSGQSSELLADKPVSLFELQHVDSTLRLETKNPIITEGTYPGDYPGEEELQVFDAEKVEREELRKEKLGDPTLEGYKTILFWNAFFHSDDFRFGIGHHPFVEHKCPVHQCITTMDKRKLGQASLVMFHGPKVDNFPPPKRPRHQLYAFVQQEPHFGMSLEELPKLNGYMNLTVTHRRDSDIWIPYARVLYDPEKIQKKPIWVDPKDKPRSVVWVVSHCSTPGKREWYVQELQKYIDIDVYGDCGDMECSKDDTWYCFEKFAREYKFYMALENNYCQDYISEKVFRPLAYDIVPIVFGGANYSYFTPPHSVIDIMDYPHPKDLARHLHFLLQNEKAYNRYFAWKSHGYEVDASRKAIMGDAFCRICELVHDPNYRFRDYKNIKAWWTNDVCDAYTIPRLRRKAKW